MNGRKKLAAVCLFILISIAATAFAAAVRSSVAAPWRGVLLWGLAVVMLAYLLVEARTLALFIRAAGHEGLRKTTKEAATALVLLNEDNEGVKTWDLRNKTGLVIGRSQDAADVDVDLMDTEYFSLISDYHAVLNFTDNGWMLADAGSKNGTALSRAGSRQRLLLVPGEPAPIKPGDTIFIAEETALAVK